MKNTKGTELAAINNPSILHCVSTISF